jgi:hypothetical protein
LTENAFHIFSNQEQSMIENVKIPRKLKHLSWSEAFNNAMNLDGLMEIEVDGISKFSIGTGIKKTKFSKNLHTWVEAGVMTLCD